MDKQTSIEYIPDERGPIRDMCEYTEYLALNGEECDELLDEYIEWRRMEYSKAWLSYTTQYE